MKQIKSYLAEVLGTFVLVLFGCGAAVVGGELRLGLLGIALAFGLAVVAMAYTIGKTSGCHLNPAVSLAMLLRGDISANTFICYVCSQIIGATAGSSLLAVIVHSTDTLGQNGFGVGPINGVAFTWYGALAIEIALTFVFILVVLAVTADKKHDNIAGLIIGLTLTLVHILGIPLTGTSVNPARSIGPALLAGGEALSQLWVFIAAPLLGAAAAFAVWKYILGGRKEI